MSGTHDVDFAVPKHAIEPIRSALAARGIVPRELPIGGLGVREGDVRMASSIGAKAASIDCARKRSRMP